MSLWNRVSNFLPTVLSNAGFMLHEHGSLGKPALVWTMLVTDTIIGLSYVVITFTLIRLVRKIKLSFSPVVVAFGTFILACGATHFMEVCNLWISNDWAAAGLKAITAAASVTTALWLVYLQPTMIHAAEAMRMAQATHDALMAAHEATEWVVHERTAELAETSARLEMALSVASMDIDEEKQAKQRLESLVERRTRELAAAQAGLASAAKLSALGEMAGCIAHEINTPLASISLQTEQAERLLASPNLTAEGRERALKKLRNMRQISHRIAEIIQGLRAFARDAEQDDFERVPVAKLVQQSLALCQTRFKHHDVQVDPERILASSLEVECRAVQVEQILINLLNNAFDAVAKLPERWVQLEVEDQGPNVAISVTDSGPGIDSKVAEKMMQPFFTTKEIGKGTGLGLSISCGLAEAHGGSLVYDRQANHTRFVLNLPKHHHDEARRKGD